MPARPLEKVLRHLRRAAAAGDQPHGASDAELLGRFAARGDQDPFELLVWRHGRMVLGVCRRLLRDAHAAEDAFQATFLALAKEAGRAGRRGSVGGWLYRVACRVALRARAGAVRQAARERPLEERPPLSREPEPCDGAARGELWEALDEQLGRLPEKYRAAFVLRDLAGKSSAEAARELGCPARTVESRLHRARQRLRERLARRGFAAPAALLAGGLCAGAAGAEASVPLVGSTVRAAAWIAAGRAVGAGLNASRAVALSEGVLRAMYLSKIKVVVAVMLALGALGVGTAGLAFQMPAAETVARTASESPTRQGRAPDPAAEDRAARQRLEKQVRELRERLLEMNSKLDLQRLDFLLEREGRKRLEEELARRRQEIDGVLRKVDVARNTVSLTLGATSLTLEAVPLTTDAKFYLGGRECSINDLKPGMAASLRVKTEGGKSAVSLIRGKEVGKKD